MMIADVKKDAENRMRKSITVLKDEFSKVRTGRAHTSLLDHIKVSSYGSEVPLTQVASVTVGDARTLVVSPWDKSMVSAVEKAILNSGMGLNPSAAGTIIRVPLPALTEERRRDLTKVVRNEAETARVGIRNVRRDANNELKKLLKDKTISQDEERRAQDEIQKLTDKHIQEVDKLLEAKEKEMMEV